MMLKAQGLTKSYRGREVLAGVDLRVGLGECLGLLGPNGSGKTTCLGILSGRVRPDRGRVQLEGEAIDHLAPHQRAQAGVSELTQTPAMFYGLTVRQNIEAVLELGTDLNRTARRGRALELLEQLGIAERAEAPARTLSGGEQRRLEIARCLAFPPKILLLDEPFAGVDPKAVEDLSASLRSLCRSGEMGVVLCDHNARSVLALCARVMLLDEGKTVLEGTPEEVVNAPKARARYLGPSFGLSRSEGQNRI